MRVLKNIAAQIPAYLLWVIASVLIWGFVFTRLTDTVPERKVTIYVNAFECSDRALAAVLQEDAPAPIRMVKVHPISYIMFDQTSIQYADLFILRGSDVEKLTDSLAPLPESVAPADAEDRIEVGGVCLGRCIYRADRDEGRATDYITYRMDNYPAEDYYLCFGARSVHLGEAYGCADDAAVTVAQRLLALN